MVILLAVAEAFSQPATPPSAATNSSPRRFGRGPANSNDVFYSLGPDSKPRDGVPMASYGIWDVDEGTFEFRRVPYDIGGAQQAIRKAKLPERFAARLETGR